MPINMPSPYFENFIQSQEILAEITDDVNKEPNGEEDPNDFEPINKSGIEDAREALQVLEDFRLFSKFGEAMLKSLKQLNRSLDREELFHKKQSVITSVFFFKAIDLSSKKNIFLYF